MDQGQVLQFDRATVFEDIMAFIEYVKKDKKKTIERKEVLNFLENLYSGRQTAEANVGAGAPVKFEGLNNEQVECFLKIFDGYKQNFEKTSTKGSLVRHEDSIVNNNGFEDVTSASAKKVVKMVPPTPPINS